MEISIYDFLKAVDESNRATKMALKDAVSILEELRELNEEGRKVMIDTLMDLISEERKKVRRRKIQFEIIHPDKTRLFDRLIPCLP